MIDSKIREAWQAATTPNIVCCEYLWDLAVAYVQAEARARTAEFWRDHDPDAEGHIEDCRFCRVELGLKTIDPRHNWMLADYIAEVEAELSK